MKKALVILMCLGMALGLLSGCNQKAKAPWLANDEIFTYDRVDPEKTVITVSRSGNIFLDGLCGAFEENNPDIQVIVLDITGGNGLDRPPVRWVANGYAPDVMFVATGIVDDASTLEYFENLSNNPVITAYESEALERESVDANIYWLPGPSKIDSMIYNKTLFEQYGWTVPKTFDEFVALCVQIREDTNGEVVPWNPNAKYTNEFLKVTEAFVYEEVFGGVDNRTWYNQFTEGKATFTGHMEPYYDVIQKLIDNDLLNEEFFSYSATTRGEEFASGKIAMINYAVANYDGEYEFDYMPFPTTTGELGYLTDFFSCLTGVPKKERGEKEQEAVDRFLAFLSSPEGQQAYIADSLMVSNTKDVPVDDGGTLASLREAIENGHMFELADFKSPLGSANFGLHGHSLSMIKGEKTAQECIAAVDEKPYIPFSDEQKPEVLATAAQDFTILQTSQFLADTYKEIAGADIGLMIDHQAYRGNLMRIFAGDIDTNNVVVLKPRSLGNDTKLAKLSMTGAQLMLALNDPVSNEEKVNCAYAFSGLKGKMAPWNDMGGKYISITLADGSAIEADKLYSVAAWEGTVKEEYITEVVELYEGTFEELMKARLQALGEIAPANDGRLQLVWN